MVIKHETFRKSERLCSEKKIKSLFDDGNILYSSLLKLVWKEADASLPGPAQAAFSVSKKQFRNAVTRNLIKRRMREAYRKNKDVLYSYLISEDIKIVFMFILKGTEIPDYKTIETAQNRMISRLIDDLSKSKSKC